MKNEIMRMDRVTLIEDEVTLLDDFNLHIFQGEIMGLVCINSDGQDALVNLICQISPSTTATFILMRSWSTATGTAPWSQTASL